MTILRFSVTPSGRAVPGRWESYGPIGRSDPVQPEPRSIRAILRAFWRRHQSRTELIRMNAHMLKDIGLTYADAEREANKPFWRA